MADLQSLIAGKRDCAILTKLRRCRSYVQSGYQFLKGNKYKGCRKGNLKRSMLILCISMLLFLVSGPQPSRCAQDEIRVSREKDKTVYSIDSSDENRLQQERERDKAWDMLRNMPVIIDKRQVNPMPVQPGPVQGQPIQPAPGK